MLWWYINKKLNRKKKGFTKKEYKRFSKDNDK